MAYKKYKTANNAICGLAMSISNMDSSVKAVWPYSRFPSENFIIKITKRDVDWAVIGRENTEIERKTTGTRSIPNERYLKINPTNKELTDYISTTEHFNI